MGTQETEREQLWGGETTKAVDNFPISGERVPVPVVRWLGRIKGTAARVNAELGLLDGDLAERIGATQVVLPPLRERSGDIPALARHLLARLADHSGLRPQTIGDDALSVLMRYGWPGNVRQLSAVLFRAALLADGQALGADHFPHIAIQSRYSGRRTDFAPHLTKSASDQAIAGAPGQGSRMSMPSPAPPPESVVMTPIFTGSAMARLDAACERPKMPAAMIFLIVFLLQIFTLSLLTMFKARCELSRVIRILSKGVVAPVIPIIRYEHGSVAHQVVVQVLSS